MDIESTHMPIKTKLYGMNIILENQKMVQK